MVTIDRRVRRTKKALTEAFVALILEKDYDDITIQEITDRADIGYRTFFRHYTDKDDLLKDTLQGMMLELRALMAPTAATLFDLMDSTVLFHHVQEHGDLYRVLIKSERAFIDSITTFAMDNLKEFLQLPPHLDIPIDVLANHVVLATFALIRWWLATDLSASVEDMQSYSKQLITDPFKTLLLQPPPKK